MKGYIFGKILVTLIILIPVFFTNGCKKQEKCGCDGDKLFSVSNTLFDYSQIKYSENGGTMWFSQGNDTYYFCNPTSMYTLYQGLDSDEQILLSGDVYWDCNYLSMAGQSYYSYYYKTYNINVTEMKSYLYGK
jgi:hypothetical protein